MALKKIPRTPWRILKALSAAGQWPWRNRASTFIYSLFAVRFLFFLLDEAGEFSPLIGV
jgi:hypothetical protein